MWFFSNVNLSRYLFVRLTGTGRTDLMRRVSRASRRTTPTATPKVTPKARKASLEGIVKHLTDLAVTISADDGSDCSASTSAVPLRDKKLKRTNMMRRRESQALLEGVRKNRLNGNVDSDASLNT